MPPPSPATKEAPPRVVNQLTDLQQAVAQARQAGRKLGLVPTMGALHEGHLSLVRRAAAECEATLVTIFVNPTQFGPQEDFSQYPRTLEADLQALSEVGAGLVYNPSRESLYPAGFSTYVDPPHVALRWEGEHRPQHFRGVTTIVLKLFLLAQADVAFFGQKDYQQACVIARMVEDLNVPIRVCVCPTVREPDGLALSSRNRYLNPEQRCRAQGLWNSLRAACQCVERGERDAAAILGQMREVLFENGISRIDYVALVDPRTLEPVARIDQPTQALVAAWVDQTRLIDNLRLEPRNPTGRKL